MTKLLPLFLLALGACAACGWLRHRHKSRASVRGETKSATPRPKPPTVVGFTSNLELQTVTPAPGVQAIRPQSELLSVPGTTDAQSNFSRETSSPGELSDVTKQDDARKNTLPVPQTEAEASAKDEADTPALTEFPKLPPAEAKAASVPFPFAGISEESGAEQSCNQTLPQNTNDKAYFTELEGASQETLCIPFVSETPEQPSAIVAEESTCSASAETALPETPQATLTPPPTETALSDEASPPVQLVSDPQSNAPTYRPTAPTRQTGTIRTRRPANIRPAQAANGELHLRVQIQFGRGGTVKHLALVPDRRNGMPKEIAVTGTQGRLNLVELRDDCYESVSLPDAGQSLAHGIEWYDQTRHWRWVLGGRELYVLARGDEVGLCGFVQTARLRLNARHVVLATARIRDNVLSALQEAGCNPPDISDENFGIPAGWLLFRDVVPTRPVQRNERDILNALRPAHEVEPHFIGGIRLERNSWLADFPPRIQFTGEFANGFQVLIDGQAACQASDGGFEAPGWNSEGEHRLWFGDRAESYSIRTMEEDWHPWHAHDFGTGVAICGASTRQLNLARQQQVRVPTSNPVLVGSHPGEVFRCDLRKDVRCETVLKMVPFTPVWALPLDSAHADKKSARILLFRPAEPAKDIQSPIRNIAANRAWISVIREAGSKGLSVAPDDAESKALWQRYRIVAKQLRRRMR